MNSKNIVFALFLSLLFNKLSAQDIFAVIKDPDGYTNTHKGNLQSKVIGKISNYQPFECFQEEDAIGSEPRIPNMVYIQYTNYVYKTGDGYFCNTEDDKKPLDGTIHKSRVHRLDDMSELKLLLQQENKAAFGNLSLKIEIKTAKFEAKKHKIKSWEGALVKAESGYASAATVDGLRMWGTDGDIPRAEIKSIKIIYTDTIVTLPLSSIKNIFEPTFEHTQISIGADNELYIWMENSDGAAVYNVIWTIVDKKLLYRFTRISFYV